MKIKCLSCNSEFFIFSKQSKMFGCPACHQAYLINEESVLIPKYKSKFYNINYQSTESISIGADVRIDKINYKIINRTVWVSEHYQYYKSPTNGNIGSFYLTHKTFECWDIVDKQENMLKIQKMDSNYNLLVATEPQFKNFAYQALYEYYDVFMKREIQVYKIDHFETGRGLLAFQNGIQHIHYLEGEMKYMIDETYCKKFSSYGDEYEGAMIESEENETNLNKAQTYKVMQGFLIKLF